MKTAQGGVEKIRELSKTCGVPATLSDWGVPRKAIKRMAESSAGNSAQRPSQSESNGSTDDLPQPTHKIPPKTISKNLTRMDLTKDKDPNFFKSYPNDHHHCYITQTRSSFPNLKP